MCTEPQGDRKHILAGLDRLDNGRKKEQMLSGDNSKRTRGGLQCVRVCVLRGAQPCVHGECMNVFCMNTHTCVGTCVSLHALFM